LHQDIERTLPPLLSLNDFFSASGTLIRSGGVDKEKKAIVAEQGIA
jgi:hypothetical protein